MDSSPSDPRPDPAAQAETGPNHEGHADDEHTGGDESGAPRDASHWIALAFMTATPVLFLAAVYLWLRSLTS